MLASILGTAFFMGLVGGPHCVAMCAAPCHMVIQGSATAQPLHPAASTALTAAPVLRWKALQFHAGRLTGYAALGALASTVMEQVAWFSDSTSALHPLWVLLHLAILFWGLLMLFQGQQPQWLERAGRALWHKVQPVLHMPGGTFGAGLAWACMPCGLLYSAVLVAALSSHALTGAASMAAFGIGSGLWLLAAPHAWQWLRGKISQWRAEWGVRVAGGLLVVVSLAALWMDLIYKPSVWCR